MNLTIYHNPRCSKSRRTLEILTARDIEPRIVRYLETPPSAAEICRLATLLGEPVSRLLRSSESIVRDAIDLPSFEDDEALADWIARHPQALQRPIVVDEDRDRAVIGRPPEAVETLLT